jgi:D-alanine-D-alanine ligase
MAKRFSRIGVLMGGRSAEREISLRTGRAVADALAERGHEVVRVDLGAEDWARAIADAKIDVAWIALHGTLGEDGCIQGLLEIAGVPYTGSGVLASALAMDKVMSKRIFESNRIPTPAWRIVEQPSEALALGLPLCIKPSEEGSSVGVTRVSEERELGAALELAARLHGVVLAERLVGGNDFSVGILDAAPGRPQVLGTVEIRPKNAFYDYEAKYERKDTEYLCPAPLPPEVDARLRAASLDAHRALGCRGYSRVDAIVTPDASELVILEVNTLPGMTSTSLLPKMAIAAGMTYGELCERILLSAGLQVKA